MGHENRIGARWLYDRLSGVRLTISLCVLLALVSLVGTLIPQNLSTARYAEQYGERAAALIESLGVGDIYHSAGFILLLCLLAANLTACTARRFPTIWRSLRRDRVVPSDLSFRGWRHRAVFEVTAGGRQEKAPVEAALRKALPSMREKTARGEVGEVFLVDRNRVARLGPYVAHVSLLLILGGGLVGALFGFRATIVLQEGGEASAVWSRGEGEQIPLGFRIRCDRFVVEAYPNGTPREYRSEVTVLDRDGEPIREADIRVNHPLTHEGITFYQSTHGDEAEVDLEVRDVDSGDVARVKTLLKEPFRLPGGRGDRGVAVRYEPSMRVPPEMVRLSRFDREDLGPAVLVRVLSPETGFGPPQWVLRDFPGMGTGEGPYRFALEAVRSIPYTGLQVVRDPGTPLVWAGCILLVIGFLLSFLMDHEILWVVVDRAAGPGVQLRVAGRAVRHPGVYAGTFERRVRKLRKELAPWLTQSQNSEAGPPPPVQEGNP